MTPWAKESEDAGVVARAVTTAASTHTSWELAMTTRAPALGDSHMRSPLPYICVAIGILGVTATDAIAQRRLQWEDFAKTQVVCDGARCTRQEVRMVWTCRMECLPNANGVGCTLQRYCGNYPQSVCVASTPACRTVRTPLPDGDLIDVTIDENAVDPSVVEFVIETPANIAWYKGITVPDGTGAKWVIWTRDRRHRDTITLWAHQVINGQSLRFAKAGFLGFWKDVYDLGGLDRLPPGSRVTFRWVRD